MKTPLIIAATVIGVLGAAGAATAVNAGALAFMQPDTSFEIVASQAPIDPSAIATEPAVDSDSTATSDPSVVNDASDDSSSYSDDVIPYQAYDESDHDESDHDESDDDESDDDDEGDDDESDD